MLDDSRSDRFPHRFVKGCLAFKRSFYVRVLVPISLDLQDGDLSAASHLKNFTVAEQLDRLEHFPSLDVVSTAMLSADRLRISIQNQ
ncbi:MAG: hypothetical protein WAK16_12900 [Candidatus Cybelea sp.]